MYECKHDPIVEMLRTELLDRSRKGIAKYGVTLERGDLDVYQWLQHLKEELLDAALYVTRIQQEGTDKMDVKISARDSTMLALGSPRIVQSVAILMALPRNGADADFLAVALTVGLSTTAAHLACDSLLERELIFLDTPEGGRTIIALTDVGKEFMNAALPPS